MYGLLLWVDDDLTPDVLFFGIVLVSPMIFGTAWTLGWLVRRRRGATRPDGSEYLTATVGNVLMGFGFVLSVLMWIAILWLGHTIGDV